MAKITFIPRPKLVGLSGSCLNRRGIGRKPKSVLGLSSAFWSTVTAIVGRESVVDIELVCGRDGA